MSAPAAPVAKTRPPSSLGTTGAVLGGGTLLVPAALAPASGAALAVAGLVYLWCLVLARAGGTQAGGQVAFVHARWGPAAARAVQGLYFAGFAVGQAAVVAAAGEFSADGAAARVTAGAVLVVAAALALLQVKPPVWMLRLRLVMVLVLVGAWWLGWLSLETAWLGPLAVVPLLFGWVGLEGVVAGPSSTAMKTAGRAAAALAPPVVLYTLLLSHTPPAGAERAAAGYAAAVVLGVYCVTNLSAAGARWPAVSGTDAAGTRCGIAIAAVLAFVVLVLAGSFDWSVGLLLLGPGAATAAIYTVLAVAAARRAASTGPGSSRRSRSCRAPR